ncbi:sulfatase-like hydrolase/transferase [Nibricoccus sp. IMCC34717]|uniref:sulfatase-like hydrolase/transferase n=1 Tax=Nibricoccus sp. IMCC34717 TaxID=3034021 RepID=UPI00384C76FF
MPRPLHFLSFFHFLSFLHFFSFLHFLSFLSFLLLPLLCLADTASTEHWRPLFHFTAPKGWINDPNGLVYVDGEWHLHAQHEWPRTWLHASSPDLIHWKMHPLALEPDATGQCWSGGIVLDEKNTSGEFPRDSKRAVAFYAAYDERAGQRIAAAYSDDLLTWRRDPHNPLLSGSTPDFRDPKVFWDEARARWAMVVTEAKKLSFLASPDLKRWTRVGDFEAQRAAANEALECPDLFQLPVSDQPGRSHWVLLHSTVSQAMWAKPPVRGTCSQHYYVGDFDGSRWVSATGPRALGHGPDEYASLTWQVRKPGAPPRVVMTGWLGHWWNAAEMPTAPWQGALSFPRDLTLITATDKQPVLAQRWAAELNDFLRPLNHVTRPQQTSGESLRLGRARSGRVRASFKASSDAMIELALFGGANPVKLRYEAASRSLQLTRPPAWGDRQPRDFAETYTAHLAPSADGTIDLDVLLDRSTIEVLAGAGTVALSAVVLPNPDDQEISFSVASGKASAVQLQLDGYIATPNIVWLTSEDNTTLLGAYGDHQASTPNLDRFAREGLLFENCFTQPVCAPARFALITGLHPVTSGPAQNMRAHGNGPAALRGFPAWLREAGYFTTNNDKTDYNCVLPLAELWDQNGPEAHWKNRKAPEQPFFSVFNFMTTHESSLFPETGSKTPRSTDPKAVRVPPYLPDTPEVRRDIAWYYDQIHAMDSEVATRLAELEQAGVLDDTVVFYFGDNGGVLPRSKRFLYNSGTHVPLLVRFPEKWRFLAPAPAGSRIQNPTTFEDFAPTVLSLAGLAPPPWSTGAAFAGTAPRAPRDIAYLSRDRMDERTDLVRALTDGRWLYLRNFRPDIPHVERLAFMFKSGAYQSWEREAEAGRLTPDTARFWNAKPAEELYDLERDPDNVTNRIHDPACAAIAARLRERMKAEALRLRDNGFIPEGSDLQGYEPSRRIAEAKYREWIDFAWRATDPALASLAELEAGLRSADEPLRWWAAQGCTVRGRAAAPLSPVLRHLLQDASAWVRVAAAEALVRLEESPEGLQTLIASAKNQASPWAGLQALNALERAGPAAAPVLADLKATLAAIGPGHDNNPDPLGYQAMLLRRILAVLEAREHPLARPHP